MMKKIITSFLAVAIVATMGVSVFAKNNRDTNVNYYFSNGTSRQTATQRRKDDSSYAYMRCISTPYSYNASVLGAMGAKGGVVDVSNGRSYRFNTGTIQYMSNYAKEWGYTYAGIAATPSNIYTYNASADWSPDSV